MKKYTFTVNNTKKDNNTNNFIFKYTKPNAVDNLKTYLAGEAVNKYPWLASTYGVTFEEPWYKKYTPKKTTTYTFTMPKKTYEELFYNFDYTTLYDLLYGYGKKYVSSDFIDEYDFKINGTPVRIMSDRIQIGYDFISKYDFNLDTNMKQNIYNIYINMYA